MDECPCGSGKAYSDCCEPIIKGEQAAENPEQVMRARYSAYAKGEIDYLLSSLHPDKREDHDPEDTRRWAENAEWHQLEIVKTEDGGPEDDEGNVEFRAHFTYKGEREIHHELAHFQKEEGTWYYLEGEPVKPETYVREGPKIGRNDPCPCGSGKKYKHCCGRSA
ncbi:MAG: YchJ family protein [Dehalococcoidia bacterium]